MVVIIGCGVVLGAVLVGFSMAGGHVEALLHISEVITIGGATLGALIINSPTNVLKDLVRGILQTLKGSAYGKAACVDLLGLLFSIARTVRVEGVIALDGHISDPAASHLFKQHPKVANNAHACHFLCDALALIVDGPVDPPKLTRWLDEEIDVIAREHHAAVGALTKTADSLPGFGIVAAVLGIVVTMQAIGGPVDEIGHKVGAALVGTFLGILMAYGFFAPLAGRMDALGEEELMFLRAIQTAVLALNEGASPRDVVVRARRVIATSCRPNQAELKQLLG